MKIKTTLLLLFTTFISFAQFPGKKIKTNQPGPDNFVYKVKDIIHLGKALNGKSFRNVFVYKHKSIFDNIDDALDLNVLPSYEVYEDKDNNMIIRGEYISALPSDFNGFRGKIRYFKYVKSKNNYYTFAILKIPNSSLRVAVPINSAILTGEMISNNSDYIVSEIDENKELDKIKIKSFSNNFDLKLLSCKGNKNTQQVSIEFLIKHKNVHQKVCVANEKSGSKAYDLNGNEFNANKTSVGSKVKKGIYSSVCNKIPTNVPVKASINFIKILPTVEKFSFVTIKITYRDFDGTYNNQYGNIEIQNLDIDWEN